MTPFSTILIANRGEIACRIIRTVAALGYKTVAVYTDADASTPHVQMADSAIRIGTGPVGDSYLCVEKIIDAARLCDAQAIHPGYGFLSENAGFAQACADSGLVFIGPSIDAIKLMGNKAESKRRMLAAEVPCVPGYHGEDQSDEVLISAAKSIEFPVMVKAAAGGGGRGMRLVEHLEELQDALHQARSEAESAFGSNQLILEQAITRPRHVEIQVFADKQGNTIHLGERDCSVQRRHQKVIEEAPCPVMSDTLREQMGAAAIAAAQSIDYVGAGTVEFLLDENDKFYFLEMNTRLQVEHPVTEMITGLDLVALQIQVAQGRSLPVSQADVVFSGHAIEARLYTEDPSQEFLPSSGTVDLWQAATGEGVRVDAGICSGQEISPYYDPMVAKLIAHGPDRETARSRLIAALKNTKLFGVTTNQQFLLECLNKPVFISGLATTSFIQDEFDSASLSAQLPQFEQLAIAAVLDYTLEFEASLRAAVTVSKPLRNWSSAGLLVSHRQYQFGQSQFDLEIRTAGRYPQQRYQVSMAGFSNYVEMVEMDHHQAQLLFDDQAIVVGYHSPSRGHVYVVIDGYTNSYENRLLRTSSANDAVGSGRITALMHGLILELNVQSGDSINKGQSLFVIEAMKMQHQVESPIEGIVKELFVEVGAQVAMDQLLIEIEPVEHKEAQ